ncbi:MAG: FAD-dependent oxidoreductase [Hyphomicrobiales bacterium]|nr:MAG: FAD-dependent oxidoreductase [Hyphomicrobiales bacterium]
MDVLSTQGINQSPIWWDDVPRPNLFDRELPKTADVLVIGSGYTGLNAAIETSRSGRNTIVLDAEDAGWGCSSRNGGQISPEIKPSFQQLSSKYGETTAFDIMAEGHRAMAWLENFIRSEQIDCDYDTPGIFVGAHTPAQYEELAKELSVHPKGLEMPGHVIPRADQHNEIGTDAYFGGVVFDKSASVHPAKLHQGLLEKALAASATIIPHCRAIAINRDGDEFQVSTSKGIIRTREILIATNGYTKGISPWLQRRIIPIGSYMIATEPLPKALMDSLLPTNRNLGDTRKVIYYYRPSPDRTRIIFGGRVTGGETDPLVSAPLLFRDLVLLFPEIAKYKVSHSWMGFIAYTFDHLAHVGKHEGIHYAMGYCGSGIAMSCYFGTRIAQQLLGKPEGRTAFDKLNFQTRPFYKGNPWFLPAAVAYYRWRDQNR